MPTVSVRHKVSDYGKWKAVYDELKPMVKSSGGKSQRLFKNSGDAKELVILTEFDDMNKAKQFAQSNDLKQAMQRAGVAEVPTIFFLDEVENAIL